VAERISFHFDENVNPVIAEALRRHGINVTTAAESSLRGRDDRTQFDFAREHNAVLVTHDRDFFTVAGNEHHFGIAYCDMNTRTIGQMIDILILLYEAATPEEMRERIEFI
jgi:predicted nuclease of predicted toxin-antitoxin system